MNVDVGYPVIVFLTLLFALRLCGREGVQKYFAYYVAGGILGYFAENVWDYVQLARIPLAYLRAYYGLY